MPTLETMDLRQKAQYWAFSSRDGHGKVQVSARVEISVRWVTTRMEALNAKGDSIAYDAGAIVDREIAVGSILWLGTSAEYAAASTPTYYQVSDYQEASDLKNRNIRRKVSLMRYGSTLPEVV